MGAPVHINRFKYFKAPSMAQIDEAIEKTGTFYAQFERVYAMPPHTIAKVKCGYRDLPAPYWQYVYDLINIPPDNPMYAAKKKETVSQLNHAKEKMKKPNVHKQRAKQDPLLVAFL